MVRGDKIQMLHGCLCRTSQSHHLAMKFVITQRGSKLHKVQESAVSAVADISIHQGDQAAIHGVTGQTKIYNL